MNMKKIVLALCLAAFRRAFIGANESQALGRRHCVAVARARRVAAALVSDGDEQSIAVIFNVVIFNDNASRSSWALSIILFSAVGLL